MSTIQVEYLVVVKLFGIVSRYERNLVQWYAKSVGKDALTILYDLGDDASGADNLTAAARSSLPAGYRTCYYSFERVRRHFGKMEQRFSVLARRWGAQTRRNFFAARNLLVEAPLALLRVGVLEGCTRPELRHVWAVEADALFAGSVRSFFADWQSDPADLLSTGYTIGGTRWWAHRLSTMKDAPRFRSDSFARSQLGLLPEPHCQVEHGGTGGKGHTPGTRHGGHGGSPDEDPTASAREHAYYAIAIRDDLRYAPGQCNDTGSVFRLTSVERYSPRLLQFLADLRARRPVSQNAAYSSACLLLISLALLPRMTSSSTSL